MSLIRRLPVLLTPMLLALSAFGVEPAAPAFRPLKDYRLEMELNITAPLPFLSRFGAVTVVVFPQGVRADGLAVKAVSRSGSSHVTVVNPTLRLFADVPIDELDTILLKQGGDESKTELMPGLKAVSTELVGQGTVSGIPAQRYRMKLRKNASIDLWTTQMIPRNEHLRAMGLTALGAISKRLADEVSKLPGTLLYVEINTPRLQKVNLLRVKSLTRSSAGSEDELVVGSFLAKAPLVDRLWN